MSRQQTLRVGVLHLSAKRFVYARILAVRSEENKNEIPLAESSFCLYLSTFIHALFILAIIASIVTVFYLRNESKKGRFEKNTNITQELKAPSSQNSLP